MTDRDHKSLFKTHYEAMLEHQEMMFIIEIGMTRVGPFKTANAAVAWALKNYSDSTPWRVARLTQP